MFNPTHKVLDQLVKSGAIKSYTRRILDGDCQPVPIPGKGMYEYEELTLEFSTGETITIESFCPGASQNSCLIYQQG